MDAVKVDSCVEVVLSCSEGGHPVPQLPVERQSCALLGMISDTQRVGAKSRQGIVHSPEHFTNELGRILRSGLGLR